MRIQDILPSSRFTTIVGSIALAGGLVYAAHALTHQTPQPVEVSVSGAAQTTPDWSAALAEIQAQSPFNKAPQVPDANNVQTLLTAATTDNITNTVARTVLVNLSAAKAQGLGNDIPTQDQIIAEAAAKIDQNRGAAAYTAADLNVIINSKEAQRTYGNAFMAVLKMHPKADLNDTLLAIGYAVDYKDASRLSAFPSVGKEYKALAKDLAGLAVPNTLVPFHLSVVNNLSRMGATYTDMQQIITDPLRGLGGLQLYQSLSEETGKVFTSIATEFSKNGILFNKDEPGETWSLFVP